MKISGDKPYVIPPYAKKVEHGERPVQGKDAKQPSFQVDRVEISNKTGQKEFKRVREVLQNVPDVREDKVSALKTAIENKTYDVNGKEVAKKMIKQSIDEFV